MNECRFTLEGTQYIAGWSVIGGTTANCGMASLTGFYLRKARRGPEGWGNMYETVSASALEVIREAVFNAVLPEVVASVRGYAIVVMSDRMLRISSTAYNHTTSSLMRELAHRRCGIVTTSPLVRNLNYPEGESDIQAMFWVPPTNLKAVVTDGRYYPTKTPFKYKARKKVYDKWLA